MKKLIAILAFIIAAYSSNAQLYLGIPINKDKDSVRYKFLLIADSVSFSSTDTILFYGHLKRIVSRKEYLVYLRKADYDRKYEATRKRIKEMPCTYVP